MQGEIGKLNILNRHKESINNSDSLDIPIDGITKYRDMDI